MAKVDSLLSAEILSKYEDHDNGPNKDAKDSVVEHFRNQIERVWKHLNYHEKQCMNSAKKHLGTDDIYACSDAKKLQKYHEYLYDKVPSTQVKDEHSDGGVPFGGNKNSIADPDTKPVTEKDINGGE
jgi:hypothetical protein